MWTQRHRFLPTAGNVHSPWIGRWLLAIVAATPAWADERGHPHSRDWVRIFTAQQEHPWAEPVAIGQGQGKLTYVGEDAGAARFGIRKQKRQHPCDIVRLMHA